jgi:regulatory protein YycI of two-component signal transduction system YycFG
VEDENSEEVTENIPSEETPITENNFHSELRDSYIKIMRSVSNIRTGNISIEPNKDSLSLQEIKNLETEIQELIDSEKENLETIY